MSTADLVGGTSRTGQAASPDLELFQHADWDFAESPRRVADVHPYPARFISELPNLAIECLRPDGPVLDPFCGSGTTLVEAIRRGHRAIGSDINPIACLISRVKTTPWDAGDDELLGRHGRALLVHAAAGATVDQEHVRDIPRVDHWFSSWAQRLLAGAVEYVHTLDVNDRWRDRLALAISACTVRISNQDSDTRYAAVAKSIGPEQALQILDEALHRIASWVKVHAPGIDTAGAQVVEANARRLPFEDGIAAAAVFSPPYPNAYEYWLYHKYRMYWLGFDPLRVRGSEIGARPYYSGSGRLTAEDFRREMAEVFSEVHRLLRPGGAAIVVVGDSIIRGEFVDNSGVVAAAADNGGFDLIGSRFRSIRRASTSFNRSHSRARDGEHVLMFGRRD